VTGVSNGRLGMMLLVGTETVLFSSFIGAYIVLRASARSWPPLGVPRLTLDLSPVNTAVLVLSSVFIYRKRVWGTFLLGLLFLVLQGWEFHRLHTRGLTLQSGPYGAFFYTLSSCHGLHVLGGLAILAIAFIKTSPFSRRQAGEGGDEGTDASALTLHPLPRSAGEGNRGEWIGNAELYWHFVTGIWLVLFSVLYIV